MVALATCSVNKYYIFFSWISRISVLGGGVLYPLELRQGQVPGIPRQLDVAIPTHRLASARSFKADGSFPVCDSTEIDFLVRHL